MTRNLFKVSAVLAAILLVIVLVRPLLSELYFTGYEGVKAGTEGIKEKELFRASKITSEEARYPYLLGLVSYFSNEKAGFDKAITSYNLSLKRNPTDSRVWLALARVYKDKGGFNRYADFAVNKAARLDLNNPLVIWEAAVYFLTENRIDAAAPLLKKYIQMSPQDQENVYALLYTMGLDPEYILQNLIPVEYKFYLSYLQFLIRNNLLNEAAGVWEKIKLLNPGRADFLSYCNFILTSGDIIKALEVWKDFLKKYAVTKVTEQSSDMPWNGGFELPVEDGGFDWRIGGAKGVSMFLDRDIKKAGDVSLGVRFDGANNPEVSIAHQIIPVEPGQNYKLEGYLKTEGLTTTNGLFLEISAFRCSPFNKRSEVLTGTNFWTKLEVEFTVPESCKAIAAGIRRERSAKFDNKISGEAWIDSLTLKTAKKK